MDISSIEFILISSIEFILKPSIEFIEIYSLAQFIDITSSGKNAN